MTLYELTAAQDYIATALEESEGVIEPGSELEQWLNDSILESLESDTKDKLDAYAGLIRSLEADEATLGEEIARLQQRKKSKQNQVAHLKRGLAYYFEKTGLSGFRTPKFTFSYKLTGKRPIELLRPVEELPTHFKRIIVEADKIAIRKAIENDVHDALKLEMMGVAKLGSATKTLSIR